MIKWMVLGLVGGVTLIEVWLLLTWGEWLGSVWTMVWMVGSFFLGVFLLRWGGLKVLVRMHRQILDEVIPTGELLEMLMVAMASLMLILPGFFTDFLGVLLILPPTKWMAIGFVRSVVNRIVGSLSPVVAMDEQHDIIDVTPRDGQSENQTGKR